MLWFLNEVASENGGYLLFNMSKHSSLFFVVVRMKWKVTGQRELLQKIMKYKRENICFLPSRLFSFPWSKLCINKAWKEEESRMRDIWMHLPSHRKPIICWNFQKHITSFSFWLPVLKFTETNKRHHEVSSMNHLFGQNRKAILKRAVIPSCCQKIKSYNSPLKCVQYLVNCEHVIIFWNRGEKHQLAAFCHRSECITANQKYF